MSYYAEAAADPTFKGGWRVSVVKPNGMRISMAANGEADALAKLPQTHEFAAFLAARESSCTGLSTGPSTPSPNTGTPSSTSS